jgi:hypothetical protein
MSMFKVIFLDTILFPYNPTHNTKTMSMYTQKATEFEVMYHEVT